MKNIRKKPIQIYIEPQQDYVLATLARKKRVSKAQIIRESLDQYLKALPVEEDPAIGIAGLGNSGKTDLSTGHDNYLAKYIRRKKR